jgi:endoglucanase
MALVFTGHEFAEGGTGIAHTLKTSGVRASFFLTGDFYRNPAFQKLIRQLKNDGHYLGAHSDRHLLYNDWTNRDSLLVTKQQFTADLLKNYDEMQRFGIQKSRARLFLPPYEWYNDSIAAWTRELGLQLINYTPGTLSHADYTGEKDRNFRNSGTIYQSITDREKKNGLHGYILLLHLGAGPGRKDKFYTRLPGLIQHLKNLGYTLVGVDELVR